MDNIVFPAAFLSSDDVVDAFIREEFQDIIREDKGAKKINSNAIADMMKVSTLLHDAIHGECIHHSGYHTGRPLNCVGGVTCNGRVIEVTDINKFIMCAQTCDIVQVIPMANGTVDVDFTLHGVTSRNYERKESRKQVVARVALNINNITSYLQESTGDFDITYVGFDDEVNAGRIQFTCDAIEFGVTNRGFIDLISDAKKIVFRVDGDSMSAICTTIEY